MLVLVKYALAFALPVIFLFYRHYNSRSEITTIPEESTEKPLKTIMQAARTDLDPPKDDPYTTEELQQYDGTDPSKPILVAIKATVFDVSNKSDVYGPGRSYSVFAGRDGSCGLGMSSLKPEDAKADYSTLNEDQMKVLDDWHAFFTKRYNIVGKVTDGPLPPAPVPTSPSDA